MTVFDCMLALEGLKTEYDISQALVIMEERELFNPLLRESVLEETEVRG